VLDDCPREQLLFQLERDDDKWWLQPLSATQSLSVDQTPVTRRTPLRHLSIVAVGRRVFLYAEHDDPNVSSSYSANLWLIDQSVASPARQRLRVTATLRLDDPRDTAEAATPLELPGAIALPERQLLIGRDEDHVDICLKDVRVSRTHAWIVRKGNTATITDLKSTNGTFVDGQRIRQPTVVQEGGRVQIGPYNLIFRAQALYPLSHDRNVELAGLRLTRRVPDGSRPGGLKVILDDISLVIRPREFVCILGPSGSGKTTLLSALSGRIPAEEGCVLLNGENLYAHFEALKQNLAVVPQRDVLHDVLPLDIALWFTAKMRLPTDMSKNDIGRRIGEMLDSVSLVPHRSTPIRRLSGG
jgi:pSer/pThr/pTyr-binding forkhead associated (FHA) protein